MPERHCSRPSFLHLLCSLSWAVNSGDIGLYERSCWAVRLCDYFLKTLSFKSIPTIRPLSLEVNKTGQTTPGYLFLNPTGFSHTNSTTPVVFTDDNKLIWNRPRGQAFNFRPYQYRGRPVLAYGNSSVFSEAVGPVGRGYDSIVLLDSSYETIATVNLREHLLTLNASQTFSTYVDVHEVNFTPQDTILITASNVTQQDLSSVGGPKPGWTVDSNHL